MVTEFKSKHFVPVAARCGFVLVRTKQSTRRVLGRECTNGLYKCSVCQKKGGGNQQECHLLETLRGVLQARPEQFVICSQLPLQKLRCDVVIVPRHARSVSQLIVVELNGTDHDYKPRQYGLAFEDAFNATVDRDSSKARLATQHGMHFFRLRRADVLNEDVVVDEQAWERRLNAVLDCVVSL